jgi:Tfp pilus assembly protein PilN
MRPVDLTPEEDRGRSGGHRPPTRAGNLSYVVVAALALGVLAVAVFAMTSKSISDKEADVAQLEQDLAAAEAEATALQPFATFRSIQESRASTVASLAQSRFDWERVIRELSLVLPSDVWLTNLTGKVLPEVSVPNEAGVSTRDTVLGPALELIGCAPGQESVAALAASLEDIDGVTRVGVSSSVLPESGSVDESGGDTGDTGDECRTRDFISKFEIVLAFDAVPVPATATAPPPSIPAPLPSGDESQLSDTTAQASAADQTAAAQNATGYVPGG